jgi:mRNA interferase RelE/StbE
MKFQIIWSESAANKLRKLDRAVARRIFKKVSELGDNPYHNVTKMVGAPHFRLRVGDYRVILNIQDDKLVVLFLRVGDRKNIYRNG